jgi:hypothetical protein
VTGWTKNSMALYMVYTKAYRFLNEFLVKKNIIFAIGSLGKMEKKILSKKVSPFFVRVLKKDSPFVRGF